MQITPVTTQIFRGQTQAQTQTKRVEIRANKGKHDYSKLKELIPD